MIFFRNFADFDEESHKTYLLLYWNKLLLFKEFENLSVEKMTLSTALGFEPRSFDCRCRQWQKFQTQLINFKLLLLCKMATYTWRGLVYNYFGIILSNSESVKFSLIESVICLFTDSSVKKYFSLSNQSIFTEIISEIWLIYSNLFLAIWINQISLVISRFWLIQI